MTATPVLFCYRDYLQGHRDNYFGVNLYFFEVPASVKGKGKKQKTGHVKASLLVAVSAAIEKIRGKKDPVVDFTLKCIAQGMKKTPCYFAARKAGFGKRKQNFLELYQQLYELQRIPAETVQETLDMEILPSIPRPDSDTLRYMERVRDLFREQLELWLSKTQELQYKTSAISVATPDEVDGAIHEHDFAFEISDIVEDFLRYYGHWQDGGWKRIRIFSDFDSEGLEEMLR